MWDVGESLSLGSRRNVSFGELSVHKAGLGGRALTRRNIARSPISPSPQAKRGKDAFNSIFALGENEREKIESHIPTCSSKWVSLFKRALGIRLSPDN